MSARGDFWARRKAAVQAEAEAEHRAIEAEAMAAERAVLEEKTDEEILAELDLPNPDSLQPGDDVRGFMAQAVPDRLRRRALRQLWKLNPVLANVDGLVDYGEDFTDAALVVENLQTAYQVGKGMLAHVEEMARQAEEKAAQAEMPEEEPALDEAEEPDAEPEVTLAEATPAPEPTPAAAPQHTQPDAEYAAAPARRMRFAFED